MRLNFFFWLFHHRPNVMQAEAAFAAKEFLRAASFYAKVIILLICFSFILCSLSFSTLNAFQIFQFPFMLCSLFCFLYFAKIDPCFPIINFLATSKRDISTNCCSNQCRCLLCFTKTTGNFFLINKNTFFNNTPRENQ